MPRSLRLIVRSQLVLALVAASALSPLVGSPAAAETSSERAAIGAYFWKDKLASTIVVDPDGPDGPLPGVVQPNPVNGQDTDLDLVARDELAVAVTVPGESNKETYLAWDLTTVPPEATITGFSVVSPLSDIPVSEDTTKTNQTTDPSEASIKACAAIQGFGVTDAGAYENKPLYDDKRCVPAKYDVAKKAFTYDVGSFAAGFFTTDVSGVALVPADTSATFQIVFGRTAKHSATIAYTMPSLPEAPVDPAPVLPLPPLNPGSGVLLPGEGFVPGAPITGGETAPVAPTVQEPTPVVQPTQGAVPIASASVPARPPSGFWLLALLLVALLAAMSVVTGSPASSAQVRGRQGAVLRQMQRRRSAGVPALGRAARV